MLGVRLSAIVIARVFTVSCADVGPLAVCTLGEGLGVKLAEIVCVLAWTGVTVTAQFDTPGVAVAANMHGAPLNASLATEEASVIVPEGVNLVPTGSTSVTVTFSVLPWPTTTVPGVSSTVVVVARVFTVSPAVVGPLAECTLGEVLGVKLAEMICVLAWAGVTVTAQLDTPGVAVAANTHGPPLNPSVPSEELTVTVPAGKNFVPSACASVTVTVTVLGSPTTTVLGDRLTVVVVTRVFTVRLAEAGPLARCTRGEALGV